MVRRSLNIGRQYHVVRYLEKMYIPEPAVGFCKLSLDICLVLDDIQGLSLAGWIQISTLLVPASRVPPLGDASVRVPINVETWQASYHVVGWQLTSRQGILFIHWASMNGESKWSNDGRFPWLMQLGADIPSLLHILFSSLCQSTHYPLSSPCDPAISYVTTGGGKQSRMGLITFISYPFDSEDKR